MELRKNPYWDALAPLIEAGSVPQSYRELRWLYCMQYSWAIPDPESIAFATSHLSPKAVEIGAGTGYWARLLAQSGVDILAFDAAPPDQVTTNPWHSPRDERTGTFYQQRRPVFYPVARGGPEQLPLHPDRVLFLCWPPYKERFALECLEQYRGERLVYVGESRGGCCATLAFFRKLEAQWREVEWHRPVHWYGSGDVFTVYERKPRRKNRS